MYVDCCHIVDRASDIIRLTIIYAGLLNICASACILKVRLSVRKCGSSFPSTRFWSSNLKYDSNCECEPTVRVV